MCEMTDISVEGGISAESVHSNHHKDLNVDYLFQHLVPKFLTP
jgi:hypothetical protein